MCSSDLGVNNGMGKLRPCLFSVTRRDIRAAYAVAGYALTMAALAWAVMRDTEAPGYSWQWYRILAYIVLLDGSPGPLLRGAGVTLMISLFSFAGTSVLALAVALLRFFASPVGRFLAWTYLELRTTQGVRIMKTSDDDSVASVGLMSERSSNEES